ncbi:MAG: hypothetical protein EPN93_06100 [Spirochaetes bacterium]|nr:MAG: hypothetical protein EPN93_06100 [Spirochaetota bacterium]
MDKEIIFQGAANDGYNEPILDDGSFVWTSSIDGEIGTGRSLSLAAPLSPGTHEITLEVTDSYGGVDSRTVTAHYPRVFGDRGTRRNGRSSTPGAGSEDGFDPADKVGNRVNRIDDILEETASGQVLLRIN